MWNLFEQPWTLLIISAVIFLVMLMLGGFRRNRWKLGLPVLLAILAVGLDLLVETDSEKIKTIIRSAVKAVEKEEPDAIEPLVSENYSDSYHDNKQRLMAHCRSRLDEPLVQKNIATILEKQILPSQATITFAVRIFFDKQSDVYQNYKPLIFTKAQLYLTKEADNQWRINRVELLEIDRQPVGWQNLSGIGEW